MSDGPADAGAFRVGPDWDPDRYVLGPAVGSGAEGILYRGSITTGTGVELQVAVKMLQPRFLDQVDRWHERWTEQVELLRSLQVPGVVPVRDGFVGPLPHGRGQPGQGRTLYLVMNWVEGEPIDEWVRHRPDRDPLDDLKVLVQVGAALDLMHSGRATGGVPVVHRDVKPSNIIVTDGGAVLVDFGLTRGLADGQRLTGITGTPGYLAPEVVEDGRYSPASDRYAFGGVAYFVITGLEVPPDHQPESIRARLAAAPAVTDRPDVVDHLMAMLETDPDRRPAGLANWIGQVRQSSLQPGPEALSPPAPRRHPARPDEPPKQRRRRGSRRRRRWTIVLAAALALVVAGTALIAVRAFTGPPGHPTAAGRTSGRPAPAAPRFSATFDPTCGQGQPVPLSYYTTSVASPAAFAVGTSGAVLGYNFNGPAGPQISQTELDAINPDCSPNQGFVAATSSGQTSPFSITALGVSDQNRQVYAGGADQGGWVIVRYQASGGLDPTFGNNGFVVHPTALSGSASPGAGAPTAMAVTPSRVYVVGVDGGSHASSRTILVSLLPTGAPDPQFNAAATKGVLITGVGAGSSGQTLAVTDSGSLLVGGSYANMGCGTFSIDEYQPSGQPVAGFRPINASGTGSGCGGSPLIPGFSAAQLTSLVALPRGKFDAVGYAFEPSSGPGLGNLAGFVTRFDADGSVDGSFGQHGTVMFPGLVQPAISVAMSNPGPSMIGAVVQPNGGLVVALVQATGVSLVSVDSGGRVTNPVKLPIDSTTPPAIATGDAGRGRIEMMTFSASQWTIRRYLGVSSSRSGLRG